MTKMVLTDAELVMMRRGLPGQMVRDIARDVSAATGIALDCLLGPSRAEDVVAARQFVMLAAWRRGATLSRIGRALGRDHTTIRHGIEAAARRFGQDLDVVRHLRAQIEGAGHE